MPPSLRCEVENSSLRPCKFSLLGFSVRDLRTRAGKDERPPNGEEPLGPCSRNWTATSLRMWTPTNCTDGCFCPGWPPPMNPLSKRISGPGYVEGITRLALVLLGDYPDHRKLRPGRKKDDHYKLSGCRSGHWVQTPEQRFRTLWAAGRVGYPKFSAPPRDVLDEFRRRHGYGPSHSAFMEWYRAHFPTDYARLFR